MMILHKKYCRLVDNEESIVRVEVKDRPKRCSISMVSYWIGYMAWLHSAQ